VFHRYLLAIESRESLHIKKREWISQERKRDIIEEEGREGRRRRPYGGGGGGGGGEGGEGEKKEEKKF